MVPTDDGKDGKDEGRSDVSLLHEDQKIGKDYVVETLLGEGAFAEVYRVRPRFLSRQAMKVLRAAGRTEAELESLLGEARLLSELGHPNIVRLFHAGTLDSAHGTYGFFTMEYVAGGSLHTYWRSHGTRFVPVDDTVQILSQVCRGLAVAHGADPPIVHRDLKPQNILVGYDASGLRARVSDFGLARRANPMTLLASSRGTPAFKPPETFADPSADSCAGDVWALGTTAYLLLTDHLPYPQVTDPLLSRPRFDTQVIPPSRLNIDVDPELDHVVLKALALRPEDRYPDAAALLDDLTAWSTTPHATGKSVSLAPTSKGLVGSPAPSFDEVAAEEKAKQALELSRQGATLPAAADLMEEAFNEAPGLRDRYAGRVRLWRRGVVQ